MLNVENSVISDKDIQNIKSNDKIRRFYEFIVDYSSKINIMSRPEVQKGYDNFVNNHVIDALHALNVIKNWKGKSFVDIGCGAGLPGIPLYLSQEGIIKNCAFVESILKKVTFLREIKNELNLNKAVVIHGRAEEIANKTENHEKYDISVIRAVGSIDYSINISLPFLRNNGLAIIYRGTVTPEDIEFSTVTAGKCGGKLEKLVKYYLENKDNERNLLVLRRIST